MVEIVTTEHLADEKRQLWEAEDRLPAAVGKRYAFSKFPPPEDPLSTIRRADQMLVMEDGRILERGNRRQLYALRGR
ncbi:MAG: hypothetical protein ACLQBJ_18295 [Bryobacteraceae bacterium]